MFIRELKRTPGKPLYRVLADELIASIENGSLKIGDALPPSRDLASTLGVSRYTVQRSYDQLSAAGYVQGISTRGIFVAGGNKSPANLVPAGEVTALGPISRYGERLGTLHHLKPNPDYLGAINFGAPPANLLPLRNWQHLLQQRLKGDLKLVYQPDVRGNIELRHALSKYLLRQKGIAAPSDNIFVFSQSQSMLQLICRLLFDEGDAIAVEDPGFGAVRNIAAAQGLTVFPLAIDIDGIITENLKTLPDSVRAIYVTPAHQDPTGAVMSLPRRKALIDWAESKGVWIIEDDFDSFFNYGTRALPSLISLAKTGTVIYTGTFWKILYPLSTLSFTVLPPALCQLMLTAKTLTEPNHDALEQLVLADYVKDGLLEKRVRRLRKIYAERRRTLIYQLKLVFGQSITIDKRSAGSHILLRLAASITEEQVCSLALESGLGMVSTQNHYMRIDHPSGQFLVDFSQLDAELATGCIKNFQRLVARAERR